MTTRNHAPFAWRRAGALAVAVTTATLVGCATPPKPYDYTAFKQSKPASLLVLPPVNQSTDVKATPSVLAQAMLPLGEAGYYVLPVTLVDQTFRDNGMTVADDIHALPTSKLREVFGADASVYITVKKYGTSYQVLASDTRVELEAKIVDLRNGALLWEGAAWASSTESNNANQAGLIGLLVQAVVEQIINTTTDASYRIAGIADNRLLGVRVNGVLPGPRSPLYGKPVTP
ncbi:MAG: DUF799 domain-containing protein [Burkholderiales bacterium]|nr:DUF799 domain-containing protein [Burkholderiales bacterium]